jgi:hypothetical protein
MFGFTLGKMTLLSSFCGWWCSLYMVANEAIFFLQIHLSCVEHSEADTMVVVILPQFPFIDFFQLLKVKKKEMF